MQSALSARLPVAARKWLSFAAAAALALPAIALAIDSLSPAARQFLLIATATLGSEDLTAIHTGMLVSNGSIGPAFGIAACFAGIFGGDLMLYLAGRLFGRAALKRAPLNWFLGEQAVAASSDWLRRRGPLVVAISRFIPGTRLPTYFAAGMLRTSPWKFTLYFMAACAAWTPILVLVSAWFGENLARSILRARTLPLLGAILSTILFWVLLKLALKTTTRRGRRLLAGQLRRWARWEFWPPYLLYPPVVAWISWLALKNRTLTAFTAANPSIFAGGFVGESKSAILDGLAGAGESIAKHRLIRAELSGGEAFRKAVEFMIDNGLTWPVVLKPDNGQRGAGVRIIRSESGLRQALDGRKRDLIVQEFIPGLEFGVFYCRRPGESRGRIISITEKVFPELAGDGRRTLEDLILDDDRAVAIAELYFEGNRARLSEVVPAGEKRRIAEIGSHCRGAVFLDGEAHLTPELESAIDRISRCFDGFHFGRYDLRVDSVEYFRQGKNLKVIELNGVTSEPTGMYDPRYNVFHAWRMLCRQWSLAFEIGIENTRLGAKPASVRQMLRLILNHARPD